jgi:hypothetical protein
MAKESGKDVLLTQMAYRCAKEKDLNQPVITTIKTFNVLPMSTNTHGKITKWKAYGSSWHRFGIRREVLKAMIASNSRKTGVKGTTPAKTRVLCCGRTRQRRPDGSRRWRVFVRQLSNKVARWLSDNNRV